MNFEANWLHRNIFTMMARHTRATGVHLNEVDIFDGCDETTGLQKQRLTKEIISRFLESLRVD